MPRTFLPLLLMVFLLAACSDDSSDTVNEPLPPWVRTFVIESGGANSLILSGTIRAQIETPVAFQVGGRVLSRQIDAGEHVNPGQLLFTLDPRDLDEAERAAQAQLASAQASQTNTENELARQRQLLAQDYISRQALERFELANQEAQARVLAARAQLEQARNTRSYGELRAMHSGTILDVFGEAGQVVSAGQTLAVLASDGARDVEVFLGEGSSAPVSGVIVLSDGSQIPIELREVAGAADATSRTWRARYQLLGTNPAAALGTTTRVRLTVDQDKTGSLTVPLGALDERGAGPQVWQVMDGHVSPIAVQVLSLGEETATIRSNLPPGTRIVALGTHLLTPDMPVREQVR